MKVQIWWTELISPEFTKQQRLSYKKFNIEQVFPIGKQIDGRRLFHAVCNDDSIDSLMGFLEDAGKLPLFVGMKKKDGSIIGDFDHELYSDYFDEEHGENRFYGWEI